MSGAETLGTTDSDKIAARAAGVRAWLSEEGLVYYPDDAIPDAVKLPLAKIVAGECATLFGRDDYKNGGVGYQELRQHCSKRSARQPVSSEFF